MTLGRAANYGAAARHSQPARVHTESPPKTFFSKFLVEPAQPKCGKKTMVEILRQFWRVSKIQVERAQHEFWKKNRLSRINSNY